MAIRIIFGGSEQVFNSIADLLSSDVGQNLTVGSDGKIYYADDDSLYFLKSDAGELASLDSVGTDEIDPTGVNPGEYTNVTLSVGPDGRITEVSNGGPTSTYTIVTSLPTASAANYLHKYTVNNPSDSSIHEKNFQCIELNGSYGYIEISQKGADCAPGADGVDAVNEVEYENEIDAVKATTADDSIIGVVSLNPSPWGISTDHASSLNESSFIPLTKAIGIKHYRVESSNGLLASEQYIQSEGFYSTRFLQTGSTFPTDLDAWGTYVSDTVNSANGLVRDWEIWNEPPNFSTSKDPVEYANLVIKAYEVIKSINPEFKVGIAAKSTRLSFLAGALDAGAAGHFDFICLHPYEAMTVAFTSDRNNEQCFANIRNIVNQVMLDKSPNDANTPIYFTEFGAVVGGDLSPDLASQGVALVKAYTLAIAQGIQHMDWFCAKDGDTPGFGLLDSSSNPQTPYYVYERLIDGLGPDPLFLGKKEFGADQNLYLFKVDESDNAAIAWNTTGNTMNVPINGEVVTDLITGATSTPTQASVGATPILIKGGLSALKSSVGDLLPFKLKGVDYTTAPRVGIDSGVELLGSNGTKTFADSSSGIDASTTALLSFYVDQNFLGFKPRFLTANILVRRNDVTESAGFNFKFNQYSDLSDNANLFGWRGIDDLDDWISIRMPLQYACSLTEFGIFMSIVSDSTAHSKFSLKSLELIDARCRDGADYALLKYDEFIGLSFNGKLIQSNVLGGDSCYTLEHNAKTSIYIDRDFIPAGVPTDVTITITVRANTPGTAGLFFNLKYYDVSGTYKNSGFNAVPSTDEWNTLTVVIPDFATGDRLVDIVLDSDSTTHADFSVKEIKVVKNA